MTLPAWMAPNTNSTIGQQYQDSNQNIGYQSQNSGAQQFSDSSQRMGYGDGYNNANFPPVNANNMDGMNKRSPGRGREKARGFGVEKLPYGSTSGKFTRRSSSASKERNRRELRRKRRKERGSNFDVLPDGMDEATANQIAAQAFLQQALPTIASAAPMPPSMLIAPASAEPNMQQTRHARRLYVGNIPSNVSEDEIHKYFTDVLTRALEKPMEGGPVVSVYLNPDRNFAFVELRSVALTTAAMQLDGISYGDIQLKIRRPSDYNAGAVSPDNSVEPVHLNLSAIGLVSNTVQESPNKIFFGGLPYHLSEDQVKELLSAFGQLKSLYLVKEPGSANSKGYAFCEYMDPSATQQAIDGLNGMSLGDKTITIRRAMPADTMGLPHMASLQQGVADQMSQLGVSSSGSGNQRSSTNVLVLLNMVGEEDLKDEDEYKEILEDVEQECRQFGDLLSIVIPRLGEPGVGKVFLHYANVEQANRAANALSGRQFASKIVRAEYHDESRFMANDLY